MSRPAMSSVQNAARARVLACCCVVSAVGAAWASPAGAQAVVASMPAPPAGHRSVDLRPGQGPFYVSTAGEVGASPSFGSLFRDLGQDFRRFASRSNVIILGVGGATSLAIRPEDGELSHQVSTSAGFDRLFEAGEGIGDGFAQGGAALGAYALGRVLGNPRLSLVGADLVRAQIVAAVLTQGVKFAVDRQRPDGGAYSFPSGHTSSTFATATVLQRHFGWKVGVPAYVVASFVGGSRLQERRHYLSDVVFGASIGIASGRAVTVGHGRATFALSPIAAPHRAGASLVLIGTR